MDLGAVLIVLVISFVFKVAVMGLAARMLLKIYDETYREPPRRLWLLLPKEHLPEIRILWCSLVLFFFAEFTCGVEIFVLTRSNAVLSGLHAVSSGLGTGLFCLGMYLLVDHKLFRFGGPKCLANRVCLGCTFDDPVRCKFRSVILLASTFVALTAFPAFLAPTARMNADMMRYVLPLPMWNHFYDHTVLPWLARFYPENVPSGVAYFLPSSMFYIEFRILPAIALALSIYGIFLIRRDREKIGMQIVAYAFGMLSYVYLEIILYPATNDVLLGSLGHELVELWFVVITAEFLRRVFPPGVSEKAEAISTASRAGP